MPIPLSQFLPLALVVTTIAGSAGLLSGTVPSTASSSSVVPDPSLANHTGATEIPVDLCVNLPDWQRPPSHVQTKQLEAMPRYGAALAEEPLAEVVKAWWSHQVFSFTTYGLSARTDPLYLSGIWTAMDDTWNCYNGEQPERINNGDLAEVWLIHHQLLGLQWQDNQYVMLVEPTPSGLQLLQFPRREQNQSLPLTLVTAAGEVLAVMAGDW